MMLSMIKGVLWTDVTFSWFAERHAYVAVLLSKIFKKKSIVVVGRYEVTYRFKYIWNLKYHR